MGCGEGAGRKYAGFVAGSLTQLRRSPFLASQAVHAAFTRSRVSTTFASAECGSRSQCSSKSTLSHFPPNFVISIRSLPDLLIFFLWAVGMANVRALVAPKRILSDIRSMIPDSLKGASNEDKVNVAWHQLRVPGSSLNELVIAITG